MGIIPVPDEPLHTIKVRLHPNNLPGAEGTYLARVSNEALLSIENVAASLKERGGFTGNYHDLVMHVRQFFDEMAYQLCDGFAVNTGYFSIHPNVGGVFNSPHEEPDTKKHPVSFSFHARPRLRELARHITVKAKGTVSGLIDRITDLCSGAVNATVTPGGLFSIGGLKIKVKGNNTDCGVYFVSADDNSQRFKVSKHLAVNTNLKVSGIVPALPQGNYFIEIKTQYTVGGIDLKEPRTISSAFTVQMRNEQ
jgi:hypothetical protein